jgi:predicted alpha/beta hydrolase family esterase
MAENIIFVKIEKVKSTVFLIHGRGGKRDTYWMNWLEKELKNKDCNVIYPSFPHPRQSIIKEWFKEFEKYERKIKENSVIIAHSLSCIFSFCLLERLKITISKTILVAPAANKKIPMVKLQTNLLQGLPKEDLKYIKLLLKT